MRIPASPVKRGSLALFFLMLAVLVSGMESFFVQTFSITHRMTLESFGSTVAVSLLLMDFLAPLAVAIPVVIAAAFVLLLLNESGKIKGDAAVAVFSTGALAIGVMVVSLSTGMNSDLNSYLFGSILAMSKEDVALSASLSVAVLILYAFFYEKLFAVTFDESFARATGIRVGLYNALLAVLTAVVVLGMRMMGALLISSLIVFPALTAMRLFKSYRGVISCSVCLAVISFAAGMFFSFWYGTPAGASIVVADVILFLIFSVIGWVGRC